MRDAVQLMSEIRETPLLSTRMERFGEFLEDEFGYTGFTYGVALDATSLESMLSTFLIKERGMPGEWMAQYQNEMLGLRDPSVVHVFLRDGFLLQSSIFDAVEAGIVPKHFCEVPTRGREFIPSGLFLPLRSGGLVGGMGLHSTLSVEAHDTQFRKHGPLIIGAVPPVS